MERVESLVLTMGIIRIKLLKAMLFDIYVLRRLKSKSDEERKVFNEWVN